jgi:hypothetical protein
MTTKERHIKEQGVIAILTIIVGCGLLVVGFSVPPLGVIDNSVLIAFGEIATFVGALVGVDYTYKLKSLIRTKR